MESNVKQRVLELFKQFSCNPTKLSKSEFAPKYGAKQTTLNGQLSEKKDVPISLSTILLILDYFSDVSAEWLLRGKGSIFRATDDEKLICREKKQSAEHFNLAKGMSESATYWKAQYDAINTMCINLQEKLSESKIQIGKYEALLEINSDFKKADAV